VKNRFIPALVLASVLSSAAVTRAQLPVTDVLALVEKITEVALQQTIKAVRQLQAEKVYKMSLRLSQWVELARYYIDAEFMPEWRIHNWFTDDVLYAKDYHWALTYGDPAGVGYASVTVKRADASSAFSAGYTPDAQAIMRSNLATLDLMDSVMVRGSHTAGQHRFGGRADAEAIIRLQEMVLETDPNASLAASLDQVAVGKIVALQSKQTRAQLETALLEQLVVEQTLEREGEAALSNMIVTRMRAYQDEGGPPSVVKNAPDALRNWRLR
jgi:hypothetical protein